MSRCFSLSSSNSYDATIWCPTIERIYDCWNLFRSFVLEIQCDRKEWSASLIRESGNVGVEQENTICKVRKMVETPAFASLRLIRSLSKDVIFLHSVGIAILLRKRRLMCRPSFLENLFTLQRLQEGDYFNVKINSLFLFCSVFESR